MYQKAIDAVSKGGDLTVGEVYVCPVCGFTMEGTVPDYCPICNAKKDKFMKF